MLLALPITFIHSQTQIEACGNLELQDTGVHVTGQNVGLISSLNRSIGFLALNNVDYGFMADANETGYYAFGNGEGYKAFQNFSHGVTSNDNFGDGIHCELAWQHGGYFATRSFSSKPAVYIEHGDDAKMDLHLNGIGNVATDSNFVFHLNSDNNGVGNSAFIIKDGGGNDVLSVHEDGDVDLIGALALSHFSSDSNFIFQLDNDNNSSSTFVVQGGICDTAFIVQENGNASLNGALKIANDHPDSSDLHFGGDAHLTADSNFIVYLNQAGTAGADSSHFQVINGADSAIMTLTANGDARFLGEVCGTLVTTCSDRRYKKQIAPLSQSLAKVMAINGVTYLWDREKFPNRFDDSRQIGFIAQDLEATFPELVRTDPQGYKSVAYDKMTAVLVEAVKDLKAENDSLREETDDLRAQLSRLDELEARLQALASQPKGL